MKNNLFENLMAVFNIEKDLKLSQQEIDNFKNYPFFVDLNLTDKDVYDNLVYLDQIIKQHELCDLSIDKCPLNNFHLYVKRLDGKLYFFNEHCQKMKDKLLEEEYKKNFFYNYYAFSKDASNKLDSKFIEENKTISISKNKAIKCFIDIMKVNGNKGFYLYGKPGVGKTYLSLTFANTAAHKYNKTICVIYLPELVETIKSSFSNKANQEQMQLRIEDIKRADIVFFDDVGAEYATEWFYSNYFLTLLNFRISSNKLTFFNSNLSINEYRRKILSKIKASDSKLITDRIIERILGLVNNFEIKIQDDKRNH